MNSICYECKTSKMLFNTCELHSLCKQCFLSYIELFNYSPFCCCGQQISKEKMRKVMENSDEMEIQGFEVEEDMKINEKDFDKITNEAYHGRMDFINDYLEENLDAIDLKDSQGQTLLYSSCRGPFPNSELIKLLLRKGANPLVPSKNEYCFHALINGLSEVLSQNMKDIEILKSLEKHRKALETLKKNNIDLNPPTKHGNMPSILLITAYESFKRKAKNEEILNELDYLMNKFCPTLKIKVFYITEKDAESQKWFMNKSEVPLLVSMMIREILHKGDNPHDSYKLDTKDLFTPANLEIKKENKKMQSLQICCLPEALGFGNVIWQQLINISDSFVWKDLPEELSEQLSTSNNRNNLHYNLHSYSIGEGLTLNGNGPMDKTLLRWLPNFGIEKLEEEDSGDEIEIKEEIVPKQGEIPENGVIPSFPIEDVKKVESTNNDSENEEVMVIKSEDVNIKQMSIDDINKNPPLKSIDLTFYFKNLKKVVGQIISSLPTILNIERTIDFQWNYEKRVINCKCNEEQEKKLKTIKKALKTFDSAINNKRLHIEKIIRDHASAILKELKNKCQKLLKEDPVLKLVNDYNEIFTNLIKEIVEESRKKFKKELKQNLPKLTKDCLEFSHSFNDPLKQWEDKIINYSRLNNCRLEALKKYFAEQARSFPKGMDKHFEFFMRFKEKIEKRAEKDFVLQLLIRDYNIHIISAAKGLPFYTDTAENLLREIQINEVLIVNTGTGSGKSTLMPLLILAEGIGIRRIAITQPRRFAAESICDALEEKYGKSLFGYRMAGKSRNPNANIVYYTDGLLRTLLTPDKELPFDLIIIDEVHERSKEIDACIALLALIKKEKKFKLPKIILASATFDNSVSGPFERVGAKISKISKMPEKKFKTISHYPDEECNPGCEICKHLRTNPHYLPMTRILLKKIEGAQQILIFLPSQNEVTAAIKLLETHNIYALPLYAQQNGKLQLEYLQKGKLFVSTNIAETSITFPCLRYVIDSGKTLRQIATDFGPKMETVNAPNSTLQQRKGRVGRTIEGDYIALYDNKSKRGEHIEPKFELEGSNDILFSLSLQLKRQIELDFPSKNSVNLLKISDKFSKYPVLGSENLIKAFHENPDCRMNILCLAAVRKTLTAKIAQTLVQSASLITGTNGDISTASALILKLVRTKFDEDRLKNQLNNWCLKHNLDQYFHNLLRAYRDAMRMIEVCKINKVHLGCCDPVDNEEFILALAGAHPNLIFLSSTLFKGPVKNYTRARDFGDGGDEHKNKITLRTISTIHSKSLLEKKNPMAILSLDFMLFDTEMKEDDHPYRLGVLQMCEEVSINKLKGIKIERRIWLRGNEALKLSAVKIQNRNFIWISGSIPDVVNKVQKLFESLMKEKQIEIKPPQDSQLLHQFNEVLQDIANAQSKSRLFQPLKYYWKNQYQVELEVHLKGKLPHFIAKGREADIDNFEAHIKFWCEQLHITPTINDPEEWSLQTNFEKPPVSKDIQERISTLTRESMKENEIWDLCNGPGATRETRMTVVGRLAIMNFDCRLIGGFIRDWIINGERKHPNIPLDQWVIKSRAGSYQKYKIIEGVLPTDLDIELSPKVYFNVTRFINDVRSAGISVDFHEHIAQRHIFLFEKERGPFMADFIEHHFAALHTQSDFDVNSLCAKSPFNNMIGLKAPLDLSIEQVINSVRSKTFTAKRALDGNMIRRKEKMEKRGWKYQGCSPFKPADDTGKRSTILPLPDTDENFKKHKDAISKIGGKNIKIYQIKNYIGEQIYESLKKTIINENNGDANEIELYHGTKLDAVTSIIHHGLDDRFWSSKGYFGRGAYHADDPKLSLSFTSPSNPKTIFVCKVLLGKQHDLSGNPLTNPLGADFFNPNGTHSVKGRIAWNGILREMEYIVYRFGQTQPLYMIEFDV